jgi:hypothetical protein
VIAAALPDTLDRWAALVWFVILVVVSPTTADANAPAPYRQPADLAGDALRLCPEAGGEDCNVPADDRLHILHERLRFDIDVEPPHDGEEPPSYRASVSATYRIRNDHDETITGPVDFVAAGVRADGEHRVSLDDNPLDVRTRATDVPDAWQPPDVFPGVDADDPIPVRRKPDVETLRFEVTIPPGEHRLQVEYELVPSIQQSGVRIDHHYVGGIPYVLAPAERWASFGGLTLEVHPPAGYRILSSLPLEPRGDHYTARFDTLPDENLALTLAPDESASHFWLAHWAGAFAWLWLMPLVLFLLYFATSRVAARLPESSGCVDTGARFLTALAGCGAAIVLWGYASMKLEPLVCGYPFTYPYGEGFKLLLGFLLIAPGTLVAVGLAAAPATDLT